MDRLARIPDMQIFTSRDPEQSCGIGTFGIRNQNMASLSTQLWERYRIWTSPILRKDYQGIRVTPNVYTTLKEIDAFCGAVEKLVA